MTFEEMDRVSTRAIKDILAQLDILKDKVKEDPASMNALMAAYKKGRDELEKRSPFMAIGESLKEWAEASKEVKAANEAYTQSIKEMNDAEREYQAILERNNMLQSMGQYGVSAEDLEETAEAQEKLNKAKEKAKKGQQNLTGAENKEISAQTKFQSALKNSASALQSMGGALSTITELMGIAEDSELGVMVNSLIGGFQTMATVLGLVATMAELVQLSFGWIGIVMVALAGLVALVTYLSKVKDLRINQQIKESERNVRSLENQYKKLKQAIEDSYGFEIIKAKELAVENKKLQLAEIQRQIQLEKSRDAKKVDLEKIQQLEGDYIDLSNEIKESVKEITSDLLGVSSVSDAAEDLVSSMVDAFKRGEDYMAVYEESFEKMIDNIIAKLIITKVIGPYLDNLWDKVTQYKKDEQQIALERVAAEQARLQQMEESVIVEDKGRSSRGFTGDKTSRGVYTTAEVEHQKQILAEAEAQLARVSEYTTEDVKNLIGMIGETKEGLIDPLVTAISEWYTYGQDSTQNLSNLQQGIQSITEDTAGAIEAYLNGISQQVYLENSQLSEIKEYISNFNFDIQLGVLSEILLQLQTSYQTQNAIQSILQGWSNANGMAVRVELQ